MGKFKILRNFKNINSFIFKIYVWIKKLNLKIFNVLGFWKLSSRRYDKVIKKIHECFRRFFCKKRISISHILKGN